MVRIRASVFVWHLAIFGLAVTAASAQRSRGSFGATSSVACFPILTRSDSAPSREPWGWSSSRFL